MVLKAEETDRILVTEEHIKLVKRRLGITALEEENKRLKTELQSHREFVRGKIAELKEYTRADADMGVRGNNTIVLTGVYRHQGYVQFYDIGDGEFERLIKKPRGSESALTGLVMPHYLQKSGYDLIYTGTGDGIHRHYPHSYVTGIFVDNEWRFRQDNRRTDTVKSIPESLHVWEYRPKKQMMLDENGNRSIFDDVDE